MSNNIHFNEKKKENLSKTLLNICFLELPAEFSRDSKKDFKSATVNDPSAFESLKLFFTHESLTSYNWDICKQCRPIIDATKDRLWVLVRTASARQF